VSCIFKDGASQRQVVPVYGLGADDSSAVRLWPTTQLIYIQSLFRL